MNSEPGNSLSRRCFLQTVATASVTAAFPLTSLSQTAPLRAAVIGHTGRGDYGHGLEGIFQNRSGIELVALADPDPAGRARTAAKIGARQAYADYRELLAKERPQLVSVAMRHADQHHAVILDCLKAGAHVYAEKPFTTHCAESDELLAAAKQRGLRIAVAHTMRMMPVMIRLRQALREGLIGEIIEMRSYGKQDARAGGEDMMVLGGHLFDLLRMFAGDPISCSARVWWQGRELVANEGRRVKDDVGLVGGDRIFALFDFAQGISASFTSVEFLRETTGHWGIEIYGSKGAARINCDIPPTVFLRKTSGWKATGKSDVWEPLDEALAKNPPPHNLGPVGDWLDAIKTGREAECSGHNGAWAVEMVMAVYRAALSRSQTNFPLKDRGHPLKAG